jgi:hypothetical protein
MDIYNTSRFARVIRLGGVYTGIAEGPEALFYNAAGIAFDQSYSFITSNGQGYAVFVEDPGNLDFALLVPYIGHGNIGLSVNTFSFSLFDEKSIQNIYSLSYGRKFSENLALGIALNYYYLKLSDIYVTGPDSPEGYLSYFSAGTFDINLSALYLFPADFRLSERDKLKAGFQLKNILSTKMKYQFRHLDGFPDADQNKFQNIRIGVSYNYIPLDYKLSGFHPVGFTAAFDAVFMGAKYNFEEWQPNYGLELALFELLQISFGRENEFTDQRDIQLFTTAPGKQVWFWFNSSIQQNL